ncbi:MAG: AIR synthase-related protein [Nitrososphaeria archaeon]
MNKKFYDSRKPFGERIREIIEQTHPKDPYTISQEISVRRIGKRYSVREMSEFLKNSEKMSVTDGTGTKGHLIWLMRAFKDSGSNPFAMTVDDLYEHNFEPYKIQSHLILQEEDRSAIIESIESLKDLCVAYKWKTPLGVDLPIIMDGGETAVCDTIQGMEFSVTATGYASPENILEGRAEAGNLLVGIASNGIHSNGLTFVRNSVLKKRALEFMLDNQTCLGEELTRPTRIYLGVLRELNELFRESITGKVHITGGGLSKLKELSKKPVCFEVFRGHNLEPQQIFNFIYHESGMSEREMLSTFNCGIGYVLSVKREVAEEIVKTICRHYPADIIGRVKSGKGQITINSPFSRNMVKF